MSPTDSWGCTSACVAALSAPLREVLVRVDDGVHHERRRPRGGLRLARAEPCSPRAFSEVRGELSLLSIQFTPVGFSLFQR